MNMRIVIELTCSGDNCEATAAGSATLKQPSNKHGGHKDYYVIEAYSVELPEGWSHRDWIFGRQADAAFCPGCSR